MENDSRRRAFKFFVTACVISAMYYFVMETFIPAVEVDGGSRVVMGTFARIVTVAKSERKANRAIKAGFDELVRIDAMMSDYKADSELSKVNREAFGKAVKVGPELFEILQISVDYSKLSQGAFDVTVGPLVDLWHKAGETNSMPDADTIAAAKAKVGYEKLILDAKAETIRFAVEGMRLDLGGIGKGYAVDKAVEAMKRKGAIGGMVDSGGNIRCFGKSAHRGNWLIGIQDPNSAYSGQRAAYSVEGAEDSQPMMVLKLVNCAVATSGDYRRFVMVGGKKVSHIIDTNTATGASKMASDTIIAPKAVDADALSTAVNVLGAEKGLDLVDSLLGVEAIIVTREGKVIKSNGVDAYLSQ
jgi:thiamine biosynthesis lipoprotein